MHRTAISIGYTNSKFYAESQAAMRVSYNDCLAIVHFIPPYFYAKIRQIYQFRIGNYNVLL